MNLNDKDMKEGLIFEILKINTSKSIIDRFESLNIMVGKKYIVESFEKDKWIKLLFYDEKNTLKDKVRDIEDNIKNNIKNNLLKNINNQIIIGKYYFQKIEVKIIAGKNFLLDYN